MVYQIPSSAVKLAQVFRLLEGIKDSLDIEGYSVSQTTLDDVCILFLMYFIVSHFISCVFHLFKYYFIGIYSFCQSTMRPICTK